MRVASLFSPKRFSWPWINRLILLLWVKIIKIEIKIAKDNLINLFDKEVAIGYKVMTGLLSIVGSRFLTLQDEVARRRGSDIMNQW